MLGQLSKLTSKAAVPPSAVINLSGIHTQLLDLLAKPAASKTAQANFRTSSVTIILVIILARNYLFHKYTWYQGRVEYLQLELCEVGSGTLLQV